MTKVRAVCLSMAAAVLAIGAGWFLWTHFRPRLYGGVGDYMKSLRKHYDTTGTALARGGPLPQDMIEMEQLAQTAQDIFVVFVDDPRSADARFSGPATALMRQGALLERSWDGGKPDEAKAAFGGMAQACNDCHAALSDGKGPTLK